MSGFSQFVLFYPVSMAELELEVLVARQLGPGYEVLTFDQPNGGTVERQLAVPFIAGMDGIEVAQARLRLKAESFPYVYQDYRKTSGSGSELGLILSFATEVRLTGVTLSGLTPPLVSDLHTVVRLALPGGGFGPPAFAEPPFSLDSPLYAPILAGASWADLGWGRFRLGLPLVRASAILIQLASGNRADRLSPLDFSAEVEAIGIDAVPEALTLSMDSTEGPVALFEHGPALLPEAGQQVVEFIPLASRELNNQLATLASDAQTLPLSISLSSATPGRIGLPELTLQARYRLHPFGESSTEISFNGGWRALAPQAVAGRQPADSRMTLLARMDGRALNAGTPVPATNPSGTGVAVSGGLWAAAPVRFLALDGQQRPLVAVRLRLATLDAAELSLRLHGDAGGLPGGALSAPMVRQLEAGAANWVEFELLDTPALGAGDVLLWVLARTTAGSALWCAASPPDNGTDAALLQDDGRSVRVSRDQGLSWGAPDRPLGQFERLEAQLFEQVPDPQPAPTITLQSAGIEATFIAAGAWQRLTDREFEARDVPVSSSLLSILANPSGDGRVEVPVDGFSTSMMTLVVEQLALFYDPGATPGAAT